VYVVGLLDWETKLGELQLNCLGALFVFASAYRFRIMEGGRKTSPINVGVAGINISSQLELCGFEGSKEL
jgi:hypothetical protein